ncbi:unnamed protein product [Cylicocyclus nassatus]|uniref:Uncharacterized protein n=1 Tax=Cylicocyclus nassatus TaxID=53992 RepID=A0AA36H9X2_CYLNA|nr:unnamed protein product [Cylicocyclus nassatus]
MYRQVRSYRFCQLVNMYLPVDPRRRQAQLAQKGQVVVMAPPYPAQTPHAIVYSTTPVTAMPSVEREDDTDAPEAPVYPAAYVVPMNAAGSYPQQILVPAPFAMKVYYWISASIT